MMCARNASRSASAAYQRRTLGRGGVGVPHLEEAVERRASRHVPHGEAVPSKEAVLREVAVEQAVRPFAVARRLGDAPLVPGLLRRAVVAPEETHERRPEIGKRPVEPTIGERALGRILGPQGARREARREVAHDRVRLPMIDTVGFEHRDQAVRVHGKEGGRVESARGAARFDVLEVGADLAEHPERLLDVERAASAPDPHPSS